MDRFERLRQWIGACLDLQDPPIEPASEDASFRRYFRVQTDAGPFVVMDAPPEREDCRPFVKIAELFGATGVHVPKVTAQNLQEGFLLLSDLGQRTYLNELSQSTALTLYNDAFDALVRIQAASRPGVLPPYDHALLLRELKLFPDWYIARHLGRVLSPEQTSSLDKVFEHVMARNLAEARVYVHRDYHSRNLMVSSPNPGILDFQDAVYGPISYDLVSLLKDAYISWQETQILDWCVRYWEKARAAQLPVPEDFGEFYKDFEWMGVQRHLKVLGIFARLWHRDGKDGYLKDMPLVMRYLRRACERYGELSPLVELLNEVDALPTATGYTF